MRHKSTVISLITALVLAFLASLMAVVIMLALASAVKASFGFEDVNLTYTEADESPTTLAGAHPFAMTTTIDFNTHVDPEKGPVLDAFAKTLIADLPPGFVANPEAVPACSNEDFVKAGESAEFQCPDEAAIGVVEAREPGAVGGDKATVYNLEPSFGEPVKFGFHVVGVTVTGSGGIRDEGGQSHAFATVQNLSQAEEIAGSRLVLWGTPAASAHDEERGRCLGEPKPGGCPVDLDEVPLITMPRSCTGPLQSVFQVDSWAEPGVFVQATSEVPAMEDCEGVGFEPTPQVQPSTAAAESAAGIDFDLDLDESGLLDPDERADSDLKAVRVTLPEGVMANPSAGEGLLACTPAQFAQESLAAADGEGCPKESRLGSLEVDTPLLAEPVGGSLYLAQQDDPETPTPGAENPFDSMLALYVIIESGRYGIFVKQAGEVQADADTGRLTSTFEDLPQLPFSHLRLHFRTGPRAPLITPPGCGTYTAQVELTPWSAPQSPVAETAAFTVSTGIGGGPCPVGEKPLAPGFEAGSLDNQAASYTPFAMRLTRTDADQEITRFSATLAPGLVGKIAGVGRCPEAAIEAAEAKTGRAELAAPSCPSSSRIGSVLGGAGVGEALTWVKGTIYLAGPFAGAPLSVVVITPAVAGPIDAGTVVIREALDLNPVTAQVEIDGAASDPIPKFLKGIPLKLRDLRVLVDRDQFTLNPTNCSPLSINATVAGSPLLASVSAPFHATGCAALGFKPALKLRLSGGTRRSATPALRAELRPRAGDANIAKTTVLFPRSMFVEQAHFRTICTRVQFAASACPKGSVYGRARAISPLLDEPLEGPVYLRANGGERELPDLVAHLKGLIDIEVVGYIDSVDGRLRSRFLTVPDAPVSKFVLRMQGGQKSLFAASQNLCARKQKADVRMAAQNGRRKTMKTVFAIKGCKGGKKKQGKR
jgi:hypothetical protein